MFKKTKERARESEKEAKHRNDALPCTCPKIRAVCVWGVMVGRGRGAGGGVVCVKAF